MHGSLRPRKPRLTVEPEFRGPPRPKRICIDSQQPGRRYSSKKAADLFSTDPELDTRTQSSCGIASRSDTIASARAKAEQPDIEE